MADQVARIYAHAVADPERGGGAWAALLTLGEHRRVESGVEPEATLDRLRLLAVVHALECLTRPMDVRIVVASLYLRRAVAAPKRILDQNDDLWQRLALADDVHTLAWTWAEESTNDPTSELAEVSRLATLALSEAASGQPSIGSVVEDFLADRTGRVSSRTFAKYEDVVWTLRWAVDWYEGKKLGDVPAAEITAQLPNFFEVLIHKQFASASELKNAKTVLPALLKWFAEQGHLDASSVATEIESLKEKLDEYVRLRRFVDALRNLCENADIGARAGSAGDQVTDEYVRIIAVTGDSITFADWDGKRREIGPVTIPPDVAQLADTGWEILLSAVLINDEWLLSNVANGEI